MKFNTLYKSIIKEEDSNLSRKDKLNLLKKNNDLLRPSKTIAPGILVRFSPKSENHRQDYLLGQIGTVVKGYLEKGHEDLWCVDFSGLECDVSTPGCRSITPGQHWVRARDLEIAI